MFCTQCGASLAEDSLFCAKCGSKTIKNSSLQPTMTETQITQTHAPAEIKEYLHHAKVLETNRYTLCSAKDHLQAKIESMGIYRGIEKPQSKAGNSFDHYWGIMGIFFIVFFPLSFVVVEDAQKHILEALFICLVLATLASVLVCIIILIINGIRHGKALSKYNRLVSLDALRVAKERQQIEGLKQQQAELDCQIKETSDTLAQLYSLDIIYPKYREFVPILTIFEYFESGRCDSLTGASGAYNLYEYESRQDIIITNLNQVISMLAQIQKNQYALYSAIQEATYYAERMCDQAEAMVASFRAIEKNSEIAAYNAKITADNTSISTYIDYCNF